MQQPSKVKDIKSFPLFLRRPESEKLMGIIHYFRPRMDWGDVTLFFTAEYPTAES
jgi:hypothetical protein